MKNNLQSTLGKPYRESWRNPKENYEASWNKISFKEHWRNPSKNLEKIQREPREKMQGEL